MNPIGEDQPFNMTGYDENCLNNCLSLNLFEIVTQLPHHLNDGNIFLFGVTWEHVSQY